MSKHKNKSKFSSKSIVSTTITKPALPPCHKGFTEIYPRIFVGKALDIDSRFLTNVDVLIPLDSVDGRIWSSGWRGDLFYMPIEDFSTLPADVQDWAVNETLDIYQSGKSIAIFCTGGHGRTGYFTSLILGKLGVEDPIDLLRTNYCEKAVECNSQVDAIAKYLDKPELKEKYQIQYSFYDEYPELYRYDFRGYSSYSNSASCYKMCYRCQYFEPVSPDSYNGWCDICEKIRYKYDNACEAFNQ